MRQVTLFLILLVSFFSCQLSYAQDWNKFANQERYKSDNEKLQPLNSNESRVVFMGNSITEAWPIIRPEFFENSAYIGRGISGQTTPQMLLRYRKDVINLQPKVVVVLAGINDIAQNTGFTPIEIIAENIITMTEIAKSNDIEVILCSVLPAIDFPWKSGLEPANKVIELNAILKNYADQNDLIYVDYHTALKDEKNGLKVPEYTSASDLVHPNADGYMVMESLVQKAIDQALAATRVSVSALFTDHMVLQRNDEVTVWGTAPAERIVNVKTSWGGSAIATTDTDGNWSLNLNTPDAGGPYELTITSNNEKIQLHDIMIGEVWLASGQSNMAMPLKGWPPSDPIANAEQEIANAEYPGIRMFKVANKYSLEKETSVDGNWTVCSPISAGDFSASAYFFARRLHKELGVPVGIVNSSWGGTPAESWVSKGSLKRVEDFKPLLESLENTNREKLTEAWYARWEKTPYPEKTEDWNKVDLKDSRLAEPDYDDSKWKTMTLPGRVDWHNEQDINGVIWFRKTFEIDDSSDSYTFEVGVVDDVDLVYVNGQKIGGTAYNFTDGRTYPIASSILKKGTNTIAIRVIDTGGPGSVSGFIGIKNSKNESISLEGDWKFQVTAELYNDHVYSYKIEELDGLVRPNIVTANAYTPTTLFNAMIHPLLSYNIKGAIWYQGESNVGRDEQYEQLFPTLIEDWRAKWNKNIPFYFVQIAPYKYQNSGDQTLDQSQKLRDAQRRTLTTPNTGMVVTMDIGNYKNIHPANKQDIGGRLAGLALKNDYRKNMVASGPLYKSNSVKRKKMLLEFDNIGSGLMSNDSGLIGFEIAGADKIFVPAMAEIIGDKIQVYAESITEPKYARYAWSDQGIGNLKNKEGLPASSFITD